MKSTFKNYIMDKENTIFTKVLDMKPVNSPAPDVSMPTDNRGNIRINVQESVLSPNTPAFQGRTGCDIRCNNHDNVYSPMNTTYQGHSGNELISLYAQQEPRVAETAPSAPDIDENAMNFRTNNIESAMFDDNPEFNSSNSRTESSSYNTNMWEDGPKTHASRQHEHSEMSDTFDFLVKSLSFANNYVSMLSREQLSVLRGLRPELLYNFLQEVARVRSDNRMRRAMPNECAFCKNNGENEECYSSHALKDWRGRVLCPVLRAFRCPRCGATGDRAHTIKYCPDNDDASERSNVSSRRTRTLLAPPAPASSPAASHQGYSQSSIWSSFNLN